ncbi:SMP-30/gluconolactonase/LRE family protein [Mycobacterium servetii]|uniref:SMP-30/gluconolactonase/LRE family protein n=1 Tax=Mycobacterium servetii TaxID=3237418 RepID=A0ABV4C0C1_9MYCO
MSEIAETPIELTGLHPVGRGVQRPEHVVVARDGHFLIANWGAGALQDLDPLTGAIATSLSGQFEGRPLAWLNFILVDSVGALWCSVSTMAEDLTDTIARGTPDGYLFRVAPDRRAAHVIADAVAFPNCMALDRDEAYLYVVRMLTADVVRFPIRGERSGPKSDSARRWGTGAPTSSAPTPAASWPAISTRRQRWPRCAPR